MRLRSPTCPGCDQPPLYVLDAGHQAFCGNDDCAVFVWDMFLTIAELADEAEYIEWRETDP